MKEMEIDLHATQLAYGYCFDNVIYKSKKPFYSCEKCITQSNCNSKKCCFNKLPKPQKP